MKTILLTLAALLFSVSVYAKDYKCTPSGKDTRWKEGSVTILQNGAQYLYQVRATGIYLTADLLCSFEGPCLGFSGGIIGVKGQLQFNPANTNEIIGVNFQAESDLIPDGHFSCN